ncbi:MAG: hypothetical protein H6814_03930 [Phycisphaeraceae bacterium]|nr:hypothetical protein [Phycisphaeraceae bacterium]
MLVRIALILSLLWQPLALIPALPVEASPASCAAPSCCAPVVERTCCGERIVRPVCGMTGGECHCAAAPLENPAEPLQAPLPRTDRDYSIPAIVLVATLTTAPGADACHRFTIDAAAPRIGGRSHQQSQALRGIWRT